MTRDVIWAVDMIGMHRKVGKAYLHRSSVGSSQFILKLLLEWHDSSSAVVAETAVNTCDTHSLTVLQRFDFYADTEYTHVRPELFISTFPISHQ